MRMVRSTASTTVASKVVARMTMYLIKRDASLRDLVGATEWAELMTWGCLTRDERAETDG